MPKDDEEQIAYIVLVNDEGQYSLWREDQEVPNGWHDVGILGSKAECVAYVDQTWIDMRPASMRL